MIQIIVLILIVIDKCLGDDTIMLVVIARHGARTANNNDIGMEWVERNGYGLSDLTHEGMVQQYILGMMVRNDYSDSLFSNDSMVPVSSDEYHLRCSKKKRTQQSMYWIMKGFNNYYINTRDVLEDHSDTKDELKEKILSVLPPFQSKRPFELSRLWETPFLSNITDKKNMNFNVKVEEPIVINLADGADKVIKGHKEDVCPHGKKKATLIANKILEQTYEKGKKRFTEMGNTVKSTLNISKSLDFKLLKKVSDSLISDKFHRPWKRTIELEKTAEDYITNLNTILHTMPYLDPVYKKLVAGNLMRDVMSHINQKISQEESQNSSPGGPSLKLLSYNVHDTNMTPLLMSLGLFDAKCHLSQFSHGHDTPCPSKPLYSSNIIIEVNRRSNPTTGGANPSNYTLSIRYNGEYTNTSIPISSLSDTIDDGFQANYCRGDSTSPSSYHAIYLLPLVLSYLIYLIFKYKHMAQQRLNIIQKMKRNE